MRILVANVNTTQSMTDSIAAQAKQAALPDTEIVGITPRFGADSCEGNFESYLAAIAVMDAVVNYPEPFDAVIQAGYGEHGREGLQELLDVPVVDITEAAASTAMFLGHKYSVITTLDRAVPLIEDRLKLAGLDARCASVRASGMAVLELEEEPERAVEAIIEQALLAVREDKAEVIVLGCGGMAGLDEEIRKRAGRPRGGRCGGCCHDCRIARPAAAEHLKGPDLRHPASQDSHRLANNGGGSARCTLARPSTQGVTP